MLSPSGRALILKKRSTLSFALESNATQGVERRTTGRRGSGLRRKEAGLARRVERQQVDVICLIQKPNISRAERDEAAHSGEGRGLN